MSHLSNFLSKTDAPALIIQGDIHTINVDCFFYFFGKILKKNNPGCKTTDAFSPPKAGHVDKSL